MVCVESDGFILNRSMAHRDETHEHPSGHIDAENSPVLRSALEKLSRLADEEEAQRQQARELLAKLGQRAGSKAQAMALPIIQRGVTDVQSLVSLADALVA